MFNKQTKQDSYFFHVFNKSIAGFRIFDSSINASRFLNTLNYYNNSSLNRSFSDYLRMKNQTLPQNILQTNENSLLQIFAYCIMPDHYHLLIKVLSETNSLSQYISKVENSFSRYLNIKLGRKGPLWQSRYKCVNIYTSEEFLHVGRYIHLNPTSANLVKHPQDWEFSSYRAYINPKSILLSPQFSVIKINTPQQYKAFTEDQQAFQRELQISKHELID